MVDAVVGGEADCGGCVAVGASVIVVSMGVVVVAVGGADGSGCCSFFSTQSL